MASAAARRGSAGRRQEASMAKRAAEAVSCHAPWDWEAFASHRPSKRGRSEAGLREPRGGKTPWSGGDGKKRKRAEGDEETSGKRPGALRRSTSPEGQVPLARGGRWGGTTSRRQEQPARLAGAAETPAAQPWSPEASVTEEEEEEEEHQDDVWHYNSFQYWRPPLPTIDLSDILGLEEEDMVKTRHSNRSGLSEMET